MATVEAIQDEAPVQGDPVARIARRIAFVLLSLVLVLAMIAGVRTTYRWKTGLQVFYNSFGTQQPWTATTGVNQTLNFVALQQPSGPQISANTVVYMDSVSAIVGKNSAHASIVFGVCDTYQTFGQSNRGNSSNADLVQARCRPAPVKGALMQDYVYGRTNNVVIARVTPTTSGVVELKGFHVRYHSGFRSGDQVLRVPIVISAK
jgi:hypothetical protein